MNHHAYHTQRWRTLRQAILRRDNHTCHWCGTQATQVDHIKPLAQGGQPYDPANLVAACAHCNSSRSNAQVNGFLRTWRARSRGIL